MRIREHAEGSLKRLQTDHIDLYQMHHIDRSCPWDEVWEAFGNLATQGKMGLVSEQSVYNLNNRTVELEVIPACRHYGLGLIPWSPHRR